MYYGVFAIKYPVLKVFTTGIWSDIDDVINKLAREIARHGVKDYNGRIIDADYIKSHIKNDYCEIDFMCPKEGHISICN